MISEPELALSPPKHNSIEFLIIEHSNSGALVFVGIGEIGEQSALPKERHSVF